MNDGKIGDMILARYSVHEDVDDALINMEAKIMQLRADLAEARADTRLWKMRTTEAVNAVDQFEEFQAENRELRRALEEISHYNEDCGIDCGTYACSCKDILIDWAAQALEDKK